MSNVLDRKQANAPQPEDFADAAASLVAIFANQMKPKAQARAKANLEAWLDRLERDPATGLPHNVCPLVRNPHAVAVEKQQDARLAAAAREVIGRCF